VTSAAELLQRISDPNIEHDERVRLRCRLAKEMEDTGNYEAAREALGELWSRVGERPSLRGLDMATAAEVLLRVGVLTGRLGSVKRMEGSQELAKNLLNESILKFEAAKEEMKMAEARMELGYCLRREGALDGARSLLTLALTRMADRADDLKAVTLLRLATVEKAALRLSDALRLLNEAAPLFEKSVKRTIKGRFHNEFGAVLKSLGALERRSDYIDRAIIEYAAAGFNFEQAGHGLYQGCAENNLGILFLTAGKYAEAHEHLDRAQALFTSLKDISRLAGVDETRASVLLAEGRVSEAEKLARAAVLVLERGGEQSLLTEALTTQGRALARLGRHVQARAVLRRAAEAAEEAGDAEAAGRAALTVIEELGGHLDFSDLEATYERAAELLAASRHPNNHDRLLACARRVLGLVGALPVPATWEGFSFKRAVRRYESRLVEGALRDAGGVVSRAAQLLGLTRQSLDSMLHRRHRRLLPLRTPPESRRASLMFREDDPARTRRVQILHVEDDALVVAAVKERLNEEGWRVVTYADGVEALREIEGEAHYDLLIIDNHLPGANGVELVSRARALPHRRQVPIIMLSAAGDVEREARGAGVSAFLRKPEDMHVLAEAIARLLARRPKQI
jgi:CheY-like chemotaxis protein